MEPMVMESTRPIVEMQNITKTFGSTRALRGVDFSVMPGEIHALLGRNGAGKSTLVSALSGFTPADSGSIKISGINIEATGQNYAASIQSVMAHVQQTPRLFDLLTVAENLLIENPTVRNKLGFVDHKLTLKRAREMVQEWHLDIQVDSLAGELDAGSRQLLEIMKALSRGVPVMILDEPTAALSNSEKRVLFEHVRTLKSKGVSFVYISHHLDEIFEIADTVTILRDGLVVKAREDVKNLSIEMIADLMMGEKTVRSARQDFTNKGQDVLLQAQDLEIKGFPGSKINFQLLPGEIVALAGPVGSGKESLALTLANQQAPIGGSITTSRSKMPTIGYVPSDRHASGYVGILGVRENITIGGLDMMSDSFGFINGQLESSHVADLVQRTNIIASSIDQALSQLSGGNQQKVVFARSLCRNPEVIVALSPTRGVDVGAKEQLYSLLRNLAALGLGVVVVSDEEDEIEQLANRVVIIFDGAIVDELVGEYKMKDLILRMEGVA